MHILNIVTSPRKEKSASTAIVDAFLAEYRARVPGEARSRSISSTGSRTALRPTFRRIRGAVVIARNTAFTYKGKPADAKTIGRELNVRYVLEGSVQRSGNRMRVNVQLIDAETVNHLWAERFDKPLADLFDM
jgi:hypothetical protein